MGRIAFIFLISAVIAGCYINMPHDARFDPDNPLGLGLVGLHVKDKSGRGVEDAVIIINGTDTVITDSQGRTQQKEMVNDTLNIHIFKEGYSEYLLDTVLMTGDSIILNAVLNYVPVILEHNIHSATVKKQGILDTMDYFVIYRAKVKDLDGSSDINIAEVLIDSMSFSMYEAGSNDSVIDYEYIFNEDADINIFDIVGNVSSIEIMDADSAASSVENIMLVRFVDNIALIKKPVNGLFFNMPDTVIWTAATETYYADITLDFTKDSVSVFRVPGLNIETREYYLDTVFSSGEYRLFVIITDRYGNYSLNSAFFTVP